MSIKISIEYIKSSSINLWTDVQTCLFNILIKCLLKTKPLIEPKPLFCWNQHSPHFCCWFCCCCSFPWSVFPYDDRPYSLSNLCEFYIVFQWTWVPRFPLWLPFRRTSIPILGYKIWILYPLLYLDVSTPSVICHHSWSQNLLNGNNRTSDRPNDVFSQNIPQNFVPKSQKILIFSFIFKWMNLHDLME